MNPSAAVDLDAGTLDAKTEAYIDRLVAIAPPLSEAQRDLIAAAFRGALTRPTRGGDAV
jgi:hypothetical protein